MLFAALGKPGALGGLLALPDELLAELFATAF